MSVSLHYDVIKAEEFHWTHCKEKVDNSITLMDTSVELFAL